MTKRTALESISLLKYSKSSNFYKNTKRDFFEKNESHLREAQRINSLYNNLSSRFGCKICGRALDNTHDFAQNMVEYKFCRECGHLNGAHEETKEFMDAIYISDDGETYAEDYLDSDFLKRSDDIYAPKVDFLRCAIGRGANVLDIGCGGGFFVYACLSNKLEAVGIDVSAKMTRYGNRLISKFLGREPLLHCEEEDNFMHHVSDTSASVITAIGVIEHLREPGKLFEAFRRSRAEYIFYSVPMFSLSAVIEGLFPQVYPRQLSGAHTHLFTETSVREMNRLMGATPIAEWRFGTDIMDLWRTLMVRSTQCGSSEHFRTMLIENFEPAVDAMQSVLDRFHFCSEIHAVLRKI